MQPHQRKKLRGLKLHNQIRFLLFVYWLRWSENMNMLIDTLSHIAHESPRALKIALVHSLILGLVLFAAPPPPSFDAFALTGLWAISYSVVFLIVFRPKRKIHWITKGPYGATRR